VAEDTTKTKAATRRSSDPPDIAQIEQDLQSTWAARDKLIERARDTRFMRIAPDIPKDWEVEEVRNCIAFNLTKRIVGTLTTDRPIITVPPAKEGDKAEEQASTIETWMSCALDQLAKQADDDPIARAVECLVADGHAAWRILHAPQLWRQYPKRNKDESDAEYIKRTDDWSAGQPLPISWVWLDPLTVYPSWDEYGLALVLETAERTINEVSPQTRKAWEKEQPALWEATRQQGAGAKFRFQQLWTRETLTYAVDGQVISHKKHPYGRPPYIYGMGDTTSSREPGLMGLPMYFPIIDLLHQYDNLLTQRATAVKLMAWPTFVHKQDTAVTDRPPYELRPGGVNPIGLQESLEPMQWPGEGSSFDKLGALYDAMIERGGLADVAYGMGGSESGYTINQLLNASRVTLKPLIQHAETMLEQAIQLIEDIIEYQIAQPVYVFSSPAKGKGKWVSLGPDDLKGYRQVTVKLQPVMPTDEYAASSMALNLVHGGLWSERRGMERVGVDQPDAEKRQILLEQVEKSQPMLGALQQAALKRLGANLQPEQPSEGDVMDVAGQLPALAQALGMDSSPQGLEQLRQQVQVIAANLAQGRSPEEIVNALLRAGASEQRAQLLVSAAQQMLAMQQGQAQQDGMPGAGGMPAQTSPGQMGAMVASGPTTQAAPGAPTPQAKSIARRPQKVGRQVRPAGIASGRAPGKKMKGDAE
jgi:hypothetical protein